MDYDICAWCKTHPLLYEYHNKEWGIPVHDDKKHFEFLTMEVMQCGLSWLLVVKKREALRAAFADFDYRKIAEFTEEDIRRAMEVPDMIRSERKIRAVINNAKVFIQIQEEFGSFDNWIWSFTDNKTYVYKRHQYDCPVSNELSDKMSKCLKKRGVKYLGTITVYSHLQAAGIINEHWDGCRYYKHINENYPVVFLDETHI